MQTVPTRISRGAALAPYAFSTHNRDIGVEPYADGFPMSEVNLGAGYGNWKQAVLPARANYLGFPPGKALS